MEQVYCIDLSRLSKIELGELIHRFDLELNLEELFRLKNSGYNIVYLDRETNKMLFYTLNSCKRQVCIGDHVKNRLSELKPLGFGTRTTKPDVHIKPPLRKRNLTKEEIVVEFNNILDKIHTHGIDSITEEEHSFLTQHKNQME